MIYVIAAFFLLTTVISIAVAVRFAKRTLQYDTIFESITPVLSSYGEELRRTLSAGLLEDHPEVAAFHKLNMRNLAAIEAITRDVVETRPKRQPGKLPKNARPPVVE